MPEEPDPEADAGERTPPGQSPERIGFLLFRPSVPATPFTLIDVCTFMYTLLKTQFVYH